MEMTTTGSRICHARRWAGIIAVSSLIFGWTSNSVFAADSVVPAAPADAAGVTAGTQVLSEMQDAFMAIAEKLEPAVVHVEAEIPAGAGENGGDNPEPVFPFAPGMPGPNEGGVPNGLLPTLSMRFS